MGVEKGKQQLGVEFAQTADRYCEMVQGREGNSAEELLRALHTLIPELYFRASLLPELEPESEQLLPPAMTDEEWQQLYRALGTTLGNYNSYWEVFDPIEVTRRDPIRTSLADDLADIYRDLKGGLIAATAANGSIPTDVIWHWRYRFTSHWGQHAMSAMRAIHSHMFMHDLAESSEESEDA